MKRYLKPERDEGTSFIMVPDKDKFKENIQQAEEKYNDKENDEMQMESHRRGGNEPTSTGTPQETFWAGKRDTT
eukprot:5573069-Ditylum_brightwellii.AAC.1